MTNPSGWSRKNTNTPAVKARKAKYDSAEHRAARKQYAKLIAYGLGICWRCGQPIPAGTPSWDWHVGHDDRDPRIIRGPEMRRCNLKAAASKGARIVNAKRKAAKFVRATR